MAIFGHIWAYSGIANAGIMPKMAIFGHIWAYSGIANAGIMPKMAILGIFGHIPALPMPG